MKTGKTVEERFWPKVMKTASCWLWTAGLTANGYGQIRAVINGKWSHLAANRVAWELCRGPIPDGMWVLHTCDVRHCVNPDHLYIGTAKENTADMMARGRGNPGRGERHGRSVLTEALVRKIRADSRTTRKIANELGINNTAVSKVKRRATWAHVKES